MESLFNKYAGLQVCNFIKKRIERRCLSENITKFLRTAFFIQRAWWLTLVLLLPSYQKQQPKVLYKKTVLENFTIFTGKQESSCWSLPVVLWILRNFKEHLFWKNICERPLLIYLYVAWYSFFKKKLQKNFKIH